MIDRWQNRGDQLPGEEVLYWHILLRDQPEAVALARLAQERLAPFAADLHFTPLEWLHITTMVVGHPSNAAPTKLLQETRKHLAPIAPAHVGTGSVAYHPEAIVLLVEPSEALRPFRTAAQAASRAITGRDGIDSEAPWIPHITVAYSTASRPAGPLIAALGRQLPRRSLTLDTLDLVTQIGPERSWAWRPLATITCGDTG
ncbi:2'-5' RNA ligase family protein [Actinomadura harenae]|uniref:2'-5' RNA ligase family protein n=2 Tax=Actinomadura harenae TaxID=2483351 RepID=A0A3M2ME47_9ACTN|nr:2'-5' RNA ligase family protein [Actinomadura harenae]